MVRASIRTSCAALAAMATLATGLGVVCASANGSGSIGKLAGRWSGGGTMVPTYGPNEQFRCIITYAVGEDTSRIRQHLRCQGGDTSFDAVTRLDISGDRVTGVWVENTYSINGTVRGTLTPRGFDIRLLGTFFQARMTVVANACEQPVIEGVASGDFLANDARRSAEARKQIDVCYNRRVADPQRIGREVR